MSHLSPLTTIVSRILDRVLRRSDYQLVWNWQARSVANARLAVAGAAGDDEYNRSGQATAKRIEAAASVRPGDVVLEIGCGTGRVGVNLAPLCARWIGADVSSGMLRHAGRAMAHLHNATFVEISGYSLAPVASESVDVVYCTGVFMHLDEWERFSYVEEAFRLLRPGGRVYVDNINLMGDEGWAQFVELKRQPPARRPPQASRTSTPEELKTYLLRAGFQDVMTEPRSLWVSARGEKPPRIEASGNSQEEG